MTRLFKIDDESIFSKGDDLTEMLAIHGIAITDQALSYCMVLLLKTFAGASRARAK